MRNHMNEIHNMKFGEVELIQRKYSCSLCSLMTSNMNDLKNHIMSVHNKEQHNWMVTEIKAEYSCDECDLKFPKMSLLNSHLDTLHSGDRGISEASNESKQVASDPEENDLGTDEIPLNEIPLNVKNFPCDCYICGELLMDNDHSQKHMKGHFEKVKIEKEDTKMPFKLKYDKMKLIVLTKKTPHPLIFLSMPGGTIYQRNQLELISNQKQPCLCMRLTR